MVRKTRGAPKKTDVVVSETDFRPTTWTLSPFEEMDRWFETMLPRRWGRGLLAERPSLLTQPFNGRTPHVDVIDRENDILVRAEIPGVAKEDLEVSMTDNTVTIKGSSRKEAEEKDGDYYRCEITHGAFSRTLALPGEVNTKATVAKLEDGILEITLPKVEKAKRQTIEVK